MFSLHKVDAPELPVGYSFNIDEMIQLDILGLLSLLRVHLHHFFFMVFLILFDDLVYLSSDTFLEVFLVYFSYNTVSFHDYIIVKLFLFTRI